MPKEDKQQYIVTLSGDRSVDEVANDLKAAGFNVDQVLDATGIVIGSADPNVSSNLRNVAGVADVSAEHPPFDIGPPGAPVS